MIEGLRPYPKYSGSGIPWLGQIPAHWNLDRVKWSFLFRKEINRHRVERNILSLTLRGVVRNNPDAPEGLVPKDYGTYQIFEKNDLVFKLIDLENLRTSRVGLVPERGIMSPAYVRMIPRSNGNVEYFYRQFYDLYQRGIYNQLGAGVRSTLGPADLLNLPILTPPADEQSLIVRFLAHANERVERVIGAKKKLIALLNEQVQVVIQKAVTRGLDPSVDLRPSGLAWFKEIPRHWQATQLRRYWQVIDCKHLTVPFVDSGIPLASVREVRSFDLDLSRAKKTTEYWFEQLTSGNRRPMKGDVLYCRNVNTGSCAYVNSDERFTMGQDVCLLRSRTENSRFLTYLMHSQFMNEQLTQMSIGATFNRINVADIKALVVLVPPRKEQDAITRDLDARLRVLNRPIDRAKIEIGLLQEYRRRLFSDIVTGQLDVRAAACELPEIAGATSENDPDGSNDSEVEEINDED